MTPHTEENNLLPDGHSCTIVNRSSYQQQLNYLKTTSRTSPGSRPLMANSHHHASQLALPHGLPMSPQSDSGSCVASATPSTNPMVVVGAIHDIGQQFDVVEAEHFAVGKKYRQLITQAQQLNQHHAQVNCKLDVYNRRLFKGLADANERNGQIQTELGRAKGREAGLQAANAEMKEKIEEQMVAMNRDAEEMQGLRETGSRLNSALTAVTAAGEDTKRQLSDLSEHRDSLLVDVAALQDTVNSRDEVVSTLHAEKVVSEEREKDLNQEIVTLRKEAETAAEELKDSLREKIELAQAVATHAVKVTMLERKIATQQSAQDMDEVKQQLRKEHDQQTSDLSREMDSWKKKYNLEKETGEACEKKRKREQEQVSHLATKLKEQQKQTADLEARLEAKQEASRQKLANEGKENTWLRSRNRELEREVQGIRNRVNGTTHSPDVYNDRHDPAGAPAKRQRFGGPSNSYRGRRGRY